MEQYDFDAVVIGGGSGGYAAARTLAAGSAKVAVIEGGREVGGLCILRGCMPTKALLHAAELRQGFREAEHWGITAADVRVDVARVFARKDELIADFAGYRRQQLEAGKFEFIRATARFTDPHTLELDGGRRVTARQFVLATGSELASVAVPGLADAGFLTSDSALRLTRLPESLIVLGGGAVGLEFAQFFARLGTAVTVIQRSAQVLRDVDEDVARELESALRREGITLFTGTRIVAVEVVNGRKQLRFTHDGAERVVAAEELFHGLGRRPATDSLNLTAAGVATAGPGFIVTDAQQRTSAPHIFAAGDCCGPHEIVHLAVQQGEVAARNILGQPAAMDYRLLLSVVFTSPAVATVGLSEHEAQAAGRDVISAKYPFNDHGKSMILGGQDGFVKLIADRATGELLGGACVGPEAGELIHEVVVALAARMTAAQFATIPHYHPTLAEIWTYPAEELAGM